MPYGAAHKGVTSCIVILLITGNLLAMTRTLRLEYPGAVYHVTSRCNARRKIYRNEKDREIFLATLAWVVERFGWFCHAYCLMDNHYHLLIETPKANLSGMRS